MMKCFFRWQRTHSVDRAKRVLNHFIQRHMKHRLKSYAWVQWLKAANANAIDRMKEAA
eukprot:SAG31_NODE_37843_length_301_cov_0.742574_1_plen_57_part_10